MTPTKDQEQGVDGGGDLREERRRGRDRYPPRSRLDQALTVARRPVNQGGALWSGAERIGDEAAPRPLSEWAAARPGGPADHTGPAGTTFGPSTATAAPPDALPTAEPVHFVIDLRPEAEQARARLPASAGGVDFGLGGRWGAAWHRSAQGWIVGTDGRAAWRPVVSTTGELSSWDVDTYLGVVTAEVAVEAAGGDFRQLGATLARGREVGLQGLVDEAVERGAHAVVGVGMQYTPIGGRLLITLTGTAVTLRDKRR
jgi:uncharacterized protein YbjQ (UPF0145 family)